MTTAWVGIGANLGDPERVVRAAIRALGELGAVCASSLYRTEPQGDANQPWFVNAVVGLESDLAPEELLKRLQELERAAGRVRAGPHWGPRELDLDLLLVGDAVLETPDLCLPHPRFHERRFVLEPLAEIAPELRDPRSGKSALELLRGLDDPLRSDRILDGSSKYNANGEEGGSSPQGGSVARRS
ncbi:MAG: 2-amino-4-hydroxy-6-hydroxymethyldihydropteridine diphosphokinase [Myxococcota bacterium]